MNYLFTSNQVPFEKLVLGYLRNRGLLQSSDHAGRVGFADTTAWGCLAHIRRGGESSATKRLRHQMHTSLG